MRVLTAALLVLSLGLMVLVLGSVVAEWQSVQSASGTGSALADALGRITFGTVIAALCLSPALVYWPRRSGVQQGRGHIGLAAVFTGLAVVLMGGVAALLLVSFLTTASDGQAALAVLIPAALNPVLAVGVDKAMSRRR